MVFFNGILVAMTSGGGAFRILSAFGGEQSPKEARGTDLDSGCGIGANVKILDPFVIRATVGSSAVQQEVTLQAVLPAFILFAALLFAGGILYLFTKETKGASLEEI